MNVGSIRALLRALTTVVFLFAIGCSQAVPTVSVLTTQLTGPKVEGTTNLVYSYTGGQVFLSGTCSTYATQVQISTDESTWSTFTSGASDSDCAGDGQFSFDMSPSDLATLGLTTVGQSTKFFVRTVMLIPTSTASVEINWEADLGPSITIARSSSNNSPTLSAAIQFPVANPSNAYKYKITSDANQCRLSNGYTNSFAEATSISNVSLAKFPDGSITLCAIGTDGTNWNPYGAARTESWIKDTKGPSVLLSTTSTSVHESFAVRADLSEPVSSFNATDFTVTGPTGATVSGFNQITAQDGTITVTPAVEGSYTIRILSGRLSDAEGNTNTGSNSLIVNFTLPTIQFSSASANVAEGNTGTSPQVITVTKSLAQVGISTVNYELVASSTATSGTDFNFTAGTLTFASGSTSATVPYEVIGDLVYEGSETLSIRLASPITNAKLGNVSTHVVTILDEESLPTVQFAAATGSGSESVSGHDIVVNLSGALAVPVRVNYSATAQTATAADYTIANGTLTFAAGTTTATIPVAVNNDNVYEGNETFMMTLSAPVGVTLGAQITHTHTIVDDENMPTIAFVVPSQSVGEGDGTRTIGVALSHPSATPVSVNYTVNPDAATGGGVDYTMASGTLTLAALATTGSLSYTVINDTISELDEAFTVELVGGSGVVLGSPISHFVNILDNDGVPTVTMAAATGTSNENDGTVNIGLQLSNPSSSAITVTYSVTGGTAVGGGVDFGLATSSYVFAAGQTTGSFMATLTDDSISELTETFEISLTGVTNATLGVPSIHTHSIVDNELLPTVQFTSANGSATEANTLVNIPVEMNRASSRTVTVDYTVSGGTAAAGTDFNLANGTLTFSPGQTTANVPLLILDDNLFEGAETVVLSLANVSSSATAGTRLTYTHTINDDEAMPTLQFSSATGSSAEGVVADVVVTLSGASGSTVSFDYAVTTTVPGVGIAANAVDYTLSNGTLSISAGQTSRTISIPIINDVIGEPNEVFEIQISNVSGGGVTLGTPASYVHTILASDTPTIQFASSSSVVQENVSGGTHTVTVELSNAADSDAVFSFADFAHTATPAVDYSVLTGSPLTIPAGSTSAQIIMTITDDTLNEPTENIQFNLSSLNAVSVVGSPNVHQVNINDNDAIPMVSFTASSSSLVESTASHTISVTLDHPSAFATSVAYSATGTANGSDYSGGSGTLNFAANQTTADIVLNVANDSIYEGNETVILTLSAPTGLTLGSPSNHTHTILDAQSMPDVQFAVSTSAISENSSPALVTVALSLASSFQTTVEYTTQAITATAGVDYSTITGTLTFPAGVTTATIAIPILDDAIYDPNENFRVILTSPSNAILGARDNNTVTILDDETQPMVSFATSTSSAGESVSSHTVPVILSATASTPVVVNYAVTGGSATSGGVDYTLANGSLTISVGQTTGNIVIPVINDTIYEGNETIELTLSSPSGATLGAASHTRTIVDDDSLPELQFSSISSSLSEAIATRTVTVSLTNASAFSASANIGYAGSATSGSDYTPGVSSMTFAPGETSKTLTITVVNDAIYEPNENVVATLSGLSGASAGPITAHTFTITNDDATPTVQFAVAASTAAESVTTRNIVVTLSGPSQANQTVTISTAGSSTLNTDYTLSSTTLTFASLSTSVTIVANVIDDAIYEGDETINLSLVSSSVLLGSPVNHVATITDNESMPSVQFQLSSDSTSESSGNATIVASLSGVSQGAVSFTISLSGGTATSGTDFFGYGSTYTINPGSMNRNIAVGINNDLIYEGNETFVFTMSGVTGATLGATSVHTHTILDDDPIPTVAFAIDTSIAASEGGTYTATVTLSNPSSQSVSVQYATSDGTATLANNDYTQTSGTLTFLAGVTTGNINVPIISDSNPEPSETFSIAISNPINATLGTITTHTGVIPLADVSDFTWVGSSIVSGNANWTNPNNWYGGVIPGPSDTAFFNSSLCLLSFCNPLINTNATVGGVVIDAGYSNTITMAAGQSLTVGAGGFAMAAGYFTGGSGGTITTSSLSLNGGTFLAPQSAVTVSGAFTLNGAAFNQNGAALTVGGATTLTSGSFAHNGATTLGAGLTKTGATLSGTGTLTVDGGWNVSNVATTTLTNIPVTFAGSTVSTISQASHTFGSVFISKSANLTSSVGLSVTGNLTINSDPGAVLTLANTSVAGDLALTQCNLSAGTIPITFSSPTSQTVTGTPNCAISSISVSKSTGTLSFAGGTLLRNNFSYTTGSVDFISNASTMTFIGSSTSTITASGLNFNNLSLSKSTPTAGVILSGNSNVNGTLSSSSTTGVLNSGTFNAMGDIIWNSPSGGTGAINATGVSNASLSCGAGCLLPNFSISKSGATFTFPAITNFQRDFVYSSGTVTSNGYKLVFSSSNTSVISASGMIIENLKVEKSGTAGVDFNLGTYVRNFEVGGTSTASLASGTLNIYGDAIGTGTNGGSAQVVFTGATDSIWQGTGWPANTYTIAKTGSASVKQTSNLTIASAQMVRLASGTFNQKGFSFNHTGGGTNVVAVGAKWIAECGTTTPGVTGSGQISTGRDVTINIQATANVSEGTSAVLAVSTTPANCEPTQFLYSTVNGTAASPGDFTNVSLAPSSVPTTGSVNLNIPTNNDGIYEGSEYFTVNLSGVGGGAVAGNIVSTVTLLDTSSIPTLDITSSGSVSEASGNYVAQFTLSGPSQSDVTFDSKTTDVTALATSDYSALANISTTIPAGQTTVSRTIAITDDNLYEGSQTFNVQFSNVVGATAGTSSKSVTILDNESLPAVTVTNANLTAFEDDTGRSIPITISPASEASLSVSFTVANGTATSGADFVVNTGSTSVVVPSGASSFNIPVQLISNLSTTEPDEDFSLQIDASGTGWARGGSYQSTMLIYDRNIGDFSISGIGNAAAEDATYDAFLNGSPEAEVVWTRADNATSYNLEIFDSNSTLVCSQSGIPYDALPTKSFLASYVAVASRMGCYLKLAGTYTARVTALRSPANATIIKNFGFTVQTNTYRDNFYANSWWGRMINNDGADTFSATGATCANASNEYYGKCIHAGEKKKFVLKGFLINEPSLTCSDLAFRDALNIFNWQCIVSGSDLIIRMHGLKDGLGVSDAIDFATGSFKPNSIIVEKAGPSLVFASPATQWWNNPFTEISTPSRKYLVNPSPGVLADPIYYVKTDLATQGLYIQSSSVILAVRPGAKVVGQTPANNDNCNTNTAEEAGIDECVLVIAKYVGATPTPISQVWVEGKFDGSASMYTVISNKVSYSRFHKVTIDHASVLGLGLGGVSSSRIEWLKIADGQEALRMKDGSSYNVVKNFMLTRTSLAGLSIGGGSSVSTNNVISSGVIHDTAYDNLNISAGNNSNVFTNLSLVTPASGYSNIKTVGNISGTTFNNILAINNTTSYNIYFGSTASTLTLSQIIGYNFSTSNFLRYPSATFSPTLKGTIRARGTSLANCFYLSSNNCPFLTSAFSSTALEDDFVGNTSDATAGTTFMSPNYIVSTITGFTDFDRFLRSFMGSPSPFSPASCSGSNCYPFDWSLKNTADFLKDRTGTGIDGTDNVWVDDGPCPAAVNGDRSISTSPNGTFLINALEILNDGVGNEDGLCQANERCLYTPNFGAFQGATNNTQSYRKCSYNPNGGLTGILMFRHSADVF